MHYIPSFRYLLALFYLPHVSYDEPVLWNISYFIVVYLALYFMVCGISSRYRLDQRPDCAVAESVAVAQCCSVVGLRASVVGRRIPPIPIRIGVR